MSCFLSLSQGFCTILGMPRPLFLPWPGSLRGEQAVGDASTWQSGTFTSLFRNRPGEPARVSSPSCFPPHCPLCSLLYSWRFSQPPLIPIYLFIFFFPGNHGSGICCCSKTHFIFILTVSVLIARSAFIRLRITLSCMRTNK